MLYHGCVYRYVLVGVPPEHFLRDTPYFGQTIRPATSHQAAFDARHKEHLRSVTRDYHNGRPEALGLHDAMRKYGVAAFERSIVDVFPPISDKDDLPRAWQPWADEEESRLIDENGGVMRYCEEEHDDKHGDQTFNLTPGGQCHRGGAHKRWGAIWARSQQAWATFWAELQAYAEANNGDMRVPHSHKTASGYALGEQVAYVRCGQLLNPGRRALLVAAEPAWSWNVKDEQSEQAWKTFWAELQAYAKANNGDMRVPHSHKTASGYALGEQVPPVRCGQLLNPGRRALLVAAEPAWSWNTRDEISEEAWKTFWAELQTYAEANNGDMRVPRLHKSASGYALGSAVSKVRQGRMLTPEHRALLVAAEPAWSWSINDDAWATFWAKLQAYAKANNGDMRVPHSHKTASGYALGRIVVDVRAGRQFHSPKHRALLKAAEPAWSWKSVSMRDARWATFCAELQAYAEANNGKMRVPFSHKTASGYALGSTVANVRNGQMLKGRPERIRLLLGLPGWRWRSKAGGDATRRAWFAAEAERLVTKPCHRTTTQK
jgi:hypothetical protein